MKWVLAFLLFARVASAYTTAGGESDVSSTLWWTIPAAGCVGSTASSNWNMSGTDVPTATCATGGSVVKTRAVLAFNDGTGATTTKPCIEMPLMTPAAPTPATASFISSGPITLAVMWNSVGATGNVKWCASVLCRGSGEVPDGGTFGTEVCTITAAKTTTLQDNLTVITLPAASTTTCQANEVLNLKFCRDSDDGTNDTTVGDASYEIMSVAWQRFQ